MRLRLLLAPTLAIALAACSNKQTEAQLEFHSLCNGIVPGTTTLGAASQTLSQNPARPSCQNDFAPIGTDDVCPYVTGQTQICELVYEFLTTNCSGPFTGGTCADYCIVRVATANPGTSTPICARQVITSQAAF
jgi:hypothetical protein